MVCAAIRKRNKISKIIETYPETLQEKAECSKGLSSQSDQMDCRILQKRRPCFEFWLLLHFDEVFQLDKQKLLDNPKVTAKRRYAENELRRIYPGYSKTRYYAEPFVRDIDKAIENEKEFCEDIEELKDSVGSNIGKLICEMRKKQ